MTTTVSSAGKATSLKRADASAVINEALETLFALAFSLANAVDPPAMSIPMDEENSEDSVTVKSPEPQYASMRCLIGFWFTSISGGKM